MAYQEVVQTSVVKKAIDPQSKHSRWTYGLPLIILTLPYRRTFKLYTAQPLKEIRAARENRDTLIPLVKRWKADKYAELASVQRTATFCAGANFSTLPWCRNANVHWATDALWYSSLICAISAIITSIQTKSILDDLPTGDELGKPNSLSDTDVQCMTRTILRYRKRPGIKHLVMLFIWQYPSMTMAYAWCYYLTGLTLYVCTPFLRGLDFSDAHRITVVYLAVAFICSIAYFSAMIFVWFGEKDLLHSVTNSPTGTLQGHPSNETEMETSQSTQSTGASVWAHCARSRTEGDQCRMLYS